MPTRRSFLMQTAAASALAAANAVVTQAGPQVAATRSKTTIRTYTIPQTDLEVSRIACGCAYLIDWTRAALSADAVSTVARVVNTAYDCGITLFDLADVYGLSKAETAFGQVLKQSPGLREKIVIQSKCGVGLADDWQPWAPLSFFDCSYEHIVNSVEGSLRRLGTDHLDILLLHYPDCLVEPQEVANAFELLEQSGKVRYFGVSNHTVGQIELLKKNVRQRLVVNQINLGLARPNAISDGLSGALEHIGIVDYCRRNDINIQAHSPLRGNLMKPPTDATEQLKESAQILRNLAIQKDTTPWVIALAWLLHHPACIIPVVGTTSPKHLIENCQADTVTLNRKEWYKLLSAARASLS